MAAGVSSGTLLGVYPRATSPKVGRRRGELCKRSQCKIKLIRALIMLIRAESSQYFQCRKGNGRYTQMKVNIINVAYNIFEEKELYIWDIKFIVIVSR